MPARGSTRSPATWRPPCGAWLAVLDAEGACWGADETGTTFGSSYAPGGRAGPGGVRRAARRASPMSAPRSAWPAANADGVRRPGRGAAGLRSDDAARPGTRRRRTRTCGRSRHPHLPDPETARPRRRLSAARAPRSRPGSTPTGCGCGRPSLGDDHGPAGFGPAARSCWSTWPTRGYLLPDVISDTGLDDAADRVLGRADARAGRTAVTYLVDRSGDPMPVMRLRPGADGRLVPRPSRRAGGAARPGRAGDVPGDLGADRLLLSGQLCRALAQRPGRPRAGVPARRRPACGWPGCSTPRRVRAGRGSRPSAGASSSAQRRERIARYLGAGRLAIRSTSRMADPLGGPGPPRRCRSGYRTDGVWVWPEGAGPLRADPRRRAGAGPAHPHRGAGVPAAGTAWPMPRSRAAVGAVRRGPSPRPVRGWLQLLPRPGRRTAGPGAAGAGRGTVRPRGPRAGPALDRRRSVSVPARPRALRRDHRGAGDRGCSTGAGPRSPTLSG